MTSSKFGDSLIPLCHILSLVYFSHQKTQSPLCVTSFKNDPILAVLQVSASRSYMKTRPWTV